MCKKLLAGDGEKHMLLVWNVQQCLVTRFAIMRVTMICDAILLGDKGW